MNRQINKPVVGKSVSNQASAARSPAPKGTLPQYILKVKDAEGNIHTLTGLFESTSKKGETYFSGKDRESGATYYVMINSKASGQA